MIGVDGDRWAGRLLDAIATGAEVDLTPPGTPSGEVGAGPSDPSGGRQVPATAIRAALLSGDLRPDTRGLRIRGAVITGALDLADAEVACSITLTSCVLEEDADFSRARLRSLVLSRCEVQGLDLVYTHVAGWLSIGRTRTNGALFGLGLQISGQLSLERVALSASAGSVLVLDEARVQGGVFMDGLTAALPVRARSIRIGGSLTLADSTFTCPGYFAVDLDLAQIDGGAYISGLRTTGMVRAHGARITGELDLRGSRLRNAGGTALSLHGAHVAGGVFVKRSTAVGEVSVAGARVGNQLNVEIGGLENPSGTALSMDRTIVEGSVYLVGLTVHGEVRALGARIDGQLGLADSFLDNPDGTALNLEGLSTESLSLRASLTVDGVVELTSARIGDLVVADDPESAFRPAALIANGWQVRAVHGALRSQRQTVVAWLDALPPGETFVPQPWGQLADVYDRNGQAADARWLRREAARRTARGSPWHARVPLRVYGALVGYGYYPAYALAWLAATFLVAALLLQGTKESFVPTDYATAASAVAAGTTTADEVEAVVTGATPCEELSPTYPCFGPVGYALATVVPPVAAIQDTAWRVSEAPLLTAALVVLKAFGWLLTVLLLAAVTGLLRKT